MFGHPALRLLIRLKARAALRQQLRRLKRPSGALFGLVGLLLVVFWFGSLWVGGALRSQAYSSGAELVLWTEIGILVLCVMTVLGAFHHRGLYLPKEEIELCFSAPVSRSDLVRYRLLVNLLRSIFAGLLFGFGAARRMPHAGFAFAGAMMTMLSIPILGQASALLLGSAENRIARIARRLPLRVVSGVLGGIVGLGFAYLLLGRDSVGDGFLGGGNLLATDGADLADAVWLKALLSPFHPWAAMVTAESAADFWPWFAACGVLWILGFELCARIPVDFRELSLATSADVAKRLTRMRRGGIGASGGQVSKDALSWRVPWLFGRAGFGAIAWLKLASIVRKARGTILLSTLIIAFVTILFTTALAGDAVHEVLVGAGLLSLVGTLYLCTGLRFDFRQDLEHMELVKSWPLAPSAIFLATILPEVALVSLLLFLGILARAVATGGYHWALFLIVGFQPLATLAWVALDNAVFLYAPVRYTPGQEGALQHMGRSILLMLLRVTLFTVVFFVTAVPIWIVIGIYQWAHSDLFGFSFEGSLAAAAGISWLALCAIDGGLVLLGGRMLRRFDVARDRG